MIAGIVPIAQTGRGIGAGRSESIKEAGSTKTTGAGESVQCATFESEESSQSLALGGVHFSPRGRFWAGGGVHVWAVAPVEGNDQACRGQVYQGIPDELGYGEQRDEVKAEDGVVDEEEQGDGCSSPGTFGR